MLTYNLDIEQGSLWLRTTPNEFALKQPYYYTEAGIFLARRDFNTKRDFKDSYLLFYTIEGCGIIEQDGNIIHLRENEALLMNCRSAQSYYTDPSVGRWSHYWAHIDGNGVEALESLMIPDHKITAFETKSSYLQEQFNILLKDLENTSATTILSESLMIHSILNDLIMRNSISYSRNQALIMKTADYLSAHYNEPFDLPALLKMAHMSKSYYMRLFRQYIGTTPYNYALNLRITKARDLLEVSDKTVHEIAMETGFSDDASFSTRFTGIVKTSPLRYRKEAITRLQKRT
ncbi:MAG: helix-turn-helix domain-containing protein [Solobacterium sp.]|nr:helix-turn-helix domain-containing protein [Solobacterium sp.]